MNWTDFWKTRPDLDDFQEFGLRDAPEFFVYHFSTIGSILDEFSTYQPVACRMPRNSKIDDWVSFP